MMKTFNNAENLIQCCGLYLVACRLQRSAATPIEHVRGFVYSDYCFVSFSFPVLFLVSYYTHRHTHIHTNTHTHTHKFTQTIY